MIKIGMDTMLVLVGMDCLHYFIGANFPSAENFTYRKVATFTMKDDLR
jgi:hypothetical protein